MTSDGVDHGPLIRSSMAATTAQACYLSTRHVAGLDEAEIGGRYLGDGARQKSVSSTL